MPTEPAVDRVISPPHLTAPAEVAAAAAAVVVPAVRAITNPK